MEDFKCSIQSSQLFIDRMNLWGEYLPCPFCGGVPTFSSGPTAILGMCIVPIVLLWDQKMPVKQLPQNCGTGVYRI